MAESRLVHDLQENFLQCAICMEGYSNPRMLPCIHSFCLQCLEKLEHSLQHQSFSCPTCRRTVRLPENGVKNLPKNFLLVSLLERINLTETTISTSLSCHFCQGDHDIELCLDCKFHFCSTCKKVHDQIPDTDDHTIIPVNKLADKKYMKKILSLQIPRCGEHRKEKLRFYCIPCGKLICLHCTIISHRGHECIEAEKRFDNAKQELKTALMDSQDQMKSVRQISETLTATTTTIQTNFRDAKRKVEGHYSTIVERLKSDKDNLIQEIENMERQERDPLKEVNDEVTNWIEAMKNTQKVTKMILEADNQWEILEMERNIMDGYKKFADDQKSLQEPSRIIRFSPDKLRISKLSNGNMLGTVNDATTSLRLPPQVRCRLHRTYSPSCRTCRLSSLIQ